MARNHNHILHLQGNTTKGMILTFWRGNLPQLSTAEHAIQKLNATAPNTIYISEKRKKKKLWNFHIILVSFRRDTYKLAPQIAEWPFGQYVIGCCERYTKYHK